MARSPGYYAVRGGRAFRVVKASSSTWVEHRDDRDVGPDLTLEQLDRLERVAVHARWRGGLVSVVRLREEAADVWTTDADLAARESLEGDRYQGWQATVAADELDEVHEEVSVTKGDAP